MTFLDFVESLYNLYGIVEKDFKILVTNITQLKRKLANALRTVTQNLLYNVWRNSKIDIMLLFDNQMVIENIFSTMFRLSKFRGAA